jgi:hypothetical protein
MHHCNANARTTGQPCRNPPMRGARRCRMHGAAAPAARRAAERRLLEARMREVLGRALAARQAELDELWRASALSRHGGRGPRSSMGGAAPAEP